MSGRAADNRLVHFVRRATRGRETWSASRSPTRRRTTWSPTSCTACAAPGRRCVGSTPGRGPHARPSASNSVCLRCLSVSADTAVTQVGRARSATANDYATDRLWIETHYPDPRPFGERVTANRRRAYVQAILLFGAIAAALLLLLPLRSNRTVQVSGWTEVAGLLLEVVGVVCPPCVEEARSAPVAAALVPLRTERTTTPTPAEPSSGSHAGRR